MGNLALIFPGSGSQYVGMGKKLYDEFPIFKRTMDEANDVLHNDIKKICFEGSLIKLNKLENMLPAIFAVSVATYRVYKDIIGVAPVYMAGHSLGEYSALCCSGVLPFSDMLKIVSARSSLAKKAAELNGGIMSVLMDVDPEEINNICKKFNYDNECVGIACYNSPRQVMISGSEKLVLMVEKMVVERDGKVIPLIGSAPYHSPLMECISSEYEEELKQYQFNDLQYPVISNVEALPYRSKKYIVSGLLQQMVKPVLWDRTIQYLETNNVDTIVEIGPRNVLKLLTKENTTKMNVLSYIEKADLKELIRISSKE
jgi:[acyl-carrier-protein] S-malonyltransferase